MPQGGRFEDGRELSICRRGIRHEEGFFSGSSPTCRIPIVGHFPFELGAGACSRSLAGVGFSGMSVQEGVQPEVAGEERPVKAAAEEPLRVLVPSQLGPLGMEFQGHLLTRIEITPPPAHRKLYRPLAEVGRSDFLDEVAGKISEYLSGVRRSPDLDYDLEAAGLDAFARRVLREVVRVPYGRTRTYKEIAALVGRKEAYRQVLAIVERNPLPLVVPCHRIIPSRDGLGAYVGGVQRKRWLLRMERAHAAELSAV